MNELEKASIEPRPAGNIEAPDPHELIDLEVRNLIYEFFYFIVFRFRANLKS